MIEPHAEPTHFIVVAGGSLGDLFPFVSMAQALQRRGHRVSFLGPEVFASLVQDAGIAFESFISREQYLAIVDDPELWDPSRGMGVIWRGLRTTLLSVHRFVSGLPRDERCVLLTHSMFLSAVGIAKASRGDTPVIAMYLSPANLRTVHDPMLLGPIEMPRWVPAWLRRGIWALLDKAMIDPMVLPDLNAAHASAGLPPVANALAHLYAVPDLSLTAFPPWFSPTQPDWPSPLLDGDFQLYEPKPHETLPPALTAFLDAGAPPVVFTPGTGHMHGAAYFAQALAAVQQLGQRAIFLSSRRDQVPADLPDSVLCLEYVRFSALLPRAAALVHPGGIGTAAQALRAGVPQLVTPFAHDQFDNAHRVQRLGAGLSLRAARMNADRLAAGLRKLLASDSVRTRCREVAAQFASQQSPDALCRAIETKLGLAA